MEIVTNHRFRKTVKIFRALIILGFIALLIMLLILIGIITYAKILGPPPLTVPQSTLIYADDSSIIGESHSGQKRYWVNLDEISPYLVDAAISIRIEISINIMALIINGLLVPPLPTSKQWQRYKGQVQSANNMPVTSISNMRKHGNGS